MKLAREARHDAIKDAIADYQTARAEAREAFRAAIGK